MDFLYRRARTARCWRNQYRLALHPHLGRRRGVAANDGVRAPAAGYQAGVSSHPPQSYLGSTSGTATQVPQWRLRRFRRYKQKRDDCPLITLALVLDGAGFPRSCKILPGNVSEPGTLEDARARLEAVCGGTVPKPTVVMVAGIAADENIAWLGERGHCWIAVSRGARPSPSGGGPEAC